MITLDSVELPYELIWVDEFSWTSVAASVRYSLQGVQHIQKTEFINGNGRPITLSSVDAWATRATILALYAKASNVATDSMVLTLHDGRIFNVLFRFWEQPVFEATPIKKLASPGDDTEYILTLKFVVV